MPTTEHSDNRHQFLKILMEAAKELKPTLEISVILSKTVDLSRRLMGAVDDADDNSDYFSHIAIREGNKLVFAKENNSPEVQQLLEDAIPDGIVDVERRNELMKGGSRYKIGIVGAIYADNIEDVENVPDVTKHEDYIDLGSAGGSQLSVAIRLDEPDETSKESIFAVLNIEHRENDFFTPDHEITLQTLANIVGVAISNKIKNQAVTSLTTAIQQLIKPVVDELEFQVNVLDTIARQAYSNATLTGRGNGAFVHIGLVVNNILIYVSSYPEETLDEFGANDYAYIDLKKGADEEGKVGVSGYAIKKDKIINVGDVTTHKQYLEVNLNANYRQVKSQLSVPIRVPNIEVPVGVISIDHPSFDAFNNYDVERTEALAQIAGQSIYLARKVTQLRSARTALQHLSKLPLDVSESMVLKIARIEAGNLFKEFNNKVVRNVENRINKKIEFTSIYTSHIAMIEGDFIIFGEDENQAEDYRKLIEIGYQQYNYRNPRADQKIGVVGLVAQTGKTQVVQDVDKHGDYFELRKTGSQISVPIIVDDRVYAVLSVEYDLTNGFDTQDRYILEAIAAQVSAMIGILKSQTERASLEEQARYSDDFIRLMRHGVRNPLSIIGHFINTAKEIKQVSASQEKWESSIKRAELELNGHLRQIDALLVLAKWDDEDVERFLELKRENLAYLVNEQITKLDLEAKNKDVRVILESDTDLIYVNADDNLLGMCMLNLIENAIKYHSKTNHNKWIKIQLSKSDGMASIVVSDNGVGMPENKIKTIFKKGGRAAEGSEQGFGLGLYLVKLIIDLHEGEIKVVSSRVETNNNEGGTTFEIQLPYISRIGEHI